jgi:hypothetical protein
VYVHSSHGVASVLSLPEMKWNMTNDFSVIRP